MLTPHFPYPCFALADSRVLKEIISRYEETNDPSLLAIIKQTISATQVIQKGSLSTEANMGEPKYEVNGSPYSGLWYRPQNDGPALRATVYMKFARVYLKVGGIEALEYVERVLYNSNNVTGSVIKGEVF
jgi:glucoamylase